MTKYERGIFIELLLERDAMFKALQNFALDVEEEHRELFFEQLTEAFNNLTKHSNSLLIINQKKLKTDCEKELENEKTEVQANAKIKKKIR